MENYGESSGSKKEALGEVVKVEIEVELKTRRFIVFGTVCCFDKIVVVIFLFGEISVLRFFTNKSDR